MVKKSVEQKIQESKQQISLLREYLSKPIDTCFREGSLFYDTGGPNQIRSDVETQASKLKAEEQKLGGLLVRKESIRVKEAGEGSSCDDDERPIAEDASPESNTCLVVWKGMTPKPPSNCEINLKRGEKVGRGYKAGSSPSDFKGSLSNISDVFVKHWIGRAKTIPKSLKFPGGDRLIPGYFMMGVAQVVEDYWRQKYPSAEVRITSHFRSTSGNHKTAAAMDFRVDTGTPGEPRVPTLQTWAGLRVLMAEGRIPNGGSGVYLNVSPDGIKGTDVSKSGERSDVLKLAGPGGSANPHYDLRYYLFDKPVGNVWVAIDTTGNGKDDNGVPKGKKGGVGTALRWLGKYRKSVRRYYNNYAARKPKPLDPFLPSVGPSVRNLNQVLYDAIHSPHKFGRGVS